VVIFKVVVRLAGRVHLLECCPNLAFFPFGFFWFLFWWGKGMKVGVVWVRFEGRKKEMRVRVIPCMSPWLVVVEVAGESGKKREEKVGIFW